MSKTKVSQKDKKDLSILPYPNSIFVVELDAHILITGFPPYYSNVGLTNHKEHQIGKCVFPIYMFKVYSAALSAAEEISIKQNKLVANAIDFYMDDPHIYNPVKFEEQQKRLTTVVKLERQKIIDAHQKLDEQNKQLSRA